MLLGGTSSFGCVTAAKSSAALDRAAALCTFQLLPGLDLVVANILFVWILPPLEVDPVRKDGVGVEVKVKVDGVVVIGLEETGTSLRIEVRVR